MAGVRYGIISDLHANQEALRVVLAHLDQEGVDQVLCLGDIVGYGASAGYCVEAVRKRAMPCQQGNHDASIRPPRDADMREEAHVALEYELGQLDDDDADWLLTLPEDPTIHEQHLVMVHGALTGRDDYILNTQALRVNLAILQEEYGQVPACFFGHSHLPMVAADDVVDAAFKKTRTFKLEPERQYIINPGSVGQPRDRCPLTSFAIYEPEARTVTIVRLPYDIQAEQERMKQAGLPDRLWQRIELGM